MSPYYWLFAILTLLFLSFLSYSTFATARLLRHWQPDRNPLLMPAENVIRVAMIGVTLVLGRLSGLSPQQLGWVSGDSQRQVLLGVGFGVLLAAFFYWTTTWLLAHGGKRFYSDTVIQAIVPKSRGELVLVLVVMVPVVVLEELLFRSLLIGGFQVLLPTTLLVIGWGVFFGVLHSPQGTWGMIGAGLAGVALGALFIFTGSLIAPFVAHYVANGVQVLQAMRRENGKEFNCEYKED